MRTGVIIQARLGSTRFPGKVLAGIIGRPMLAYVLARAEAIGADETVLAIPEGKEDDPLAWWGEQLAAPVKRGPLNDVLARYWKVAREAEYEVIVRITADCPLLCPVVAGQVLKMVTGHVEYASNVHPDRSYPDGCDVEAFTLNILARAFQEATTAHDREHVTPWMQREALLTACLKNPHGDWSRVRWTVDLPADLEPIRRIVSHMLPDTMVSTFEETRTAAFAAEVWPAI